MYLQKKSSKKKTFASVSAKRRKKRRMKKIFLLLIFCLFLFLFFWCINKGLQYVFEHKSQWFAWRAKTLVLQAEDDTTFQQIKDLINFKENTLVSKEDANNLQNSIVMKLPQVKEAQVKRGFLSKKLTVKAQNHRVLANLKTNEDSSYLISETGVLFNYDKAKTDSKTLQVRVEEKIKGSFLPQELVKLLKDISNSNVKDLDFVSLDLKQEILTLHLKDGTTVAMGSFDLYNEKVGALKDIIDISQKKGFKKPYKIDFNYFKYGKIYLNTQV